MPDLAKLIYLQNKLVLQSCPESKSRYTGSGGTNCHSCNGKRPGYYLKPAAPEILELNQFMPLIADALLENLTLLNSASVIFRDHCVSGIIANEEVCKRNVENSTATITALIPKIGYEKASEIVKIAQKNFFPLRKRQLNRNTSWKRFQ
jgi:hypothetical protein